MLPKGSSGKDYVKEIARLINEWIESPIRECTMFALLLQKPSKPSKSKDHIDALKWRLEK